LVVLYPLDVHLVLILSNYLYLWWNRNLNAGS